MDEKEKILFMNPHWEEDFFYNFPIKRNIFNKLIEHINQPLIISMNGPRRVGKTVLMKQIINFLIKEGFPRKNILFFSFDEFRGHPLEIIKIWESLLNKKIRGKNYFVFFDEIQNIDNWSEKIKLIYDNLNIKIFISGSSFMSIKKGLESLAGRILEFKINPLFYNEFLLFSGRKISEIKEIEWKNYKEYMQRQLPKLAIFDSLSPHEYITSIVKKVIYEDVRKFFGVEETEKIEGIFKVICNDPGEIINVVDIAKDFGISRVTASNYLNALEKSYLIRKLYNFSNNPRKTEIRLKKYYPYYTNLIFYSYFAEFGKIAETEVAWKTGADFFWNDRGKEVDFILGNMGIEVKMRKIIDDADVKWLFNERLKLKERILVSSPLSKIKIKKNLKVIPLNKIDKFVNLTFQKC